MSNVAIDVVIPVYNAAETLDASLGSILNQTFEDFRVIVVDDGSTDRSPALLAAWAEKDRRVEVLRRPNGGIVAALNAGLAAVSAPIVARMDADDLSAPDRFARQHAWLDEHADCVAVGCQVDHIDARGRPVHGLPQPGAPDVADAFRLPAREPYIIHPFLMARTDAVRAVGGYRQVPHSEDSDLFWRLEEVGSLYNLPLRLGSYRMHMDSISGASIVDGRVMAVGSQLGALSARRRRAGEADLSFERNLIGDLRKARDLQGMCATVASMLQGHELALFKLAAGIKLLELAGYRPYEVEPSDCAFIASALDPAYEAATDANRGEVDYYLTRTGSRLLRAGRVRDAATLAPRRLWPKTGLKTLLFR